PQLERIVGPDAAAYLDSLGIAERMQVLGGSFKYAFTGVSATIRKAEYMGRLLQAAQIAAAPPYQSWSSMSEWLGSVVDAFSLGAKVHVNEQPMMPVDQAKQLAQQAHDQATKAPQPPRVNIALQGKLDPLTSKDLADGTLDGTLAGQPLGPGPAPGPGPAVGPPGMPPVPNRELAGRVPGGP